ncbi:hypothetical protein OHT76_02950 [Streptomyces sp. NBC_00287]|uniref:DUF6777 domain-containing protein n=1 Tax=Streptomyces sp. NBC_00287 TaxID=2975702 RepID=UPI002E2B0848|nr:DUF6777 domain-containing protein [Streptomyces sp. NBC_00287]
MSAEPPSSGRPTGPPSGPLSGPTQPPSGPPSQPPGSGGGGPPPSTGGGGVTPEPEPRRPWWRSVPRVAVLATVVVAAVVLAVVFSRSDGGGSGSDGEVFLQAAGKSGPDPFTESTATDSSAPPVTPSPATGTATTNAVRGVDGAAPGLYGGTRNVASCDVEKQIKALQAEPAKNRAFASVAGVDPTDVPAYLRGLTPVQLRMDTRVTNHGYRDGSATSYQAVLQSGTAVLVDDRGVPRVRCACGNPLTPPVAQQTAPKTTGDSWPSYKSSNVVVVAPATVVINVFVVYDPEQDDWFERHPGDTGGKDQKTDPPAHEPAPSVTEPPTTSPSPGATTACPATPTGTETTCPPTSKTPPEPIAPETSEPTSEPPAEPESPGTTSPQVPLASDTTATATQSLPTGVSPLSPAM